MFPECLPMLLTTAVFVAVNVSCVEIRYAPSRVSITRPTPYNREGRNPTAADEILDQNKSSISKPVNHSIDNKLDDSSHPELMSWPRVFVLNRDPSYPVVCYSGVSLNITDNGDVPASSGQGEQTNSMTSNKRPLRLFVLSWDPRFPVLCREGHIPASLTVDDDETWEDEDISGDIRNVTCIRRDYEKDISAIFLHKTGPIQTAWNVFNSSIAYGFFTVENVESIGHIKLINETIVECEDYQFVIDNKGLSAGTAASLVG